MLDQSSAARPCDPRAAGDRAAAGAAGSSRSGRPHGRGAHRPAVGQRDRAAARRSTSRRMPSPRTTTWPGWPAPASSSSRPARDRPGPRRAAGGRVRAGSPAARRLARPVAGRSAGPGDVADRLILQMGRLEREELRVVLLDTKNHVLRVQTVYQGNVVRVAGPRRRAVPGRGPGQRGGAHPRPQPPERRPDAVTGRPAPHRGGAGRRAAARHRPARPPRHRPRRLRLAARPRRRLRPPGMPPEAAAVAGFRGGLVPRRCVGRSQFGRSASTR